jgi:leucyl aminopeptidase
MEFRAYPGTQGQRRTDCTVVGVYEGRKLAPSPLALDAASRRAVERVLRQRDFEGKPCTTLVLHGVADRSPGRVLLVGLGREGELREGRYRGALRSATEALRAIGAVEATFGLPELPVNGRERAWKIEQAVLAVMDGLYRFDVLKSGRAEARRALKKVLFPVARRADVPAAMAAIGRGAAIADGIALARDLGNLPANLCTPAYLAAQARALGKRHRFEVKVLGTREIERLGMGGFLAVARGSHQPPRLIVMEHRGGPRGARPVVLVGKGITFDAGGISMKPAFEMDEMKFDMCGAASVFGALRASALLELPLNIVGIVPAAENMPGGNATKPGDIVTTMSGRTVEILDTDAEGRLALCDALTYAARYRPAALVDIATLTGAIVVALGEAASGLFSNDGALAREIVEAGESAWDRAWRMPLFEDYQEALESNFADLPNIASHAADAITGACFLARFARRLPWAHLDVAGTASKSGEEKGATGRPVALLMHFLVRRAAAQRAGAARSSGQSVRGARCEGWSQWAGPRR